MTTALSSYTTSRDVISDGSDFRFTTVSETFALLHPHHGLTTRGEHA